MSEVKVNKISPRSGTNVQLGDSGDTITVPSGATLDASNATTTLPANVVTTTGSQTLTNKIIGSSQLTGALPALDGSALTGIPDTIAPTRHSIRPSLNLDFANSKALDPRITFTRASNATYYDGYTSVKAEENLFLYSQEFDNAYWGKARITVTANDTTAPDGTTTAEKISESTITTGEFVVYQQVASYLTPIVNNSYTTSIYAKADILNFFAIRIYQSSTKHSTKVFDLSGGTITASDQSGTDVVINSASITNAGSGWYRCSVTFTTTTTTQVQSAFCLSNSGTPAYGSNGEPLYTSTGTGSVYIWGGQLEQRDTVTAYTPTTSSPITKYQPALQTAGNNVARFDHNPTTGESLGLLIEEQRTNLLLYSEDINLTSGYSAIKQSNVIIAPNGTLTGDKAVSNSSASTLQGFSYLFNAVSLTNHTGSIFAKKGELNRFNINIGGGNGTLFDLDSGTIISTSSIQSSIIDIGNGWYRCSITYLPSSTSQTQLRILLAENNSTSSSMTNFTGDDYSGIYFWGAQIEQGSFPTSYIKTTSSQVTRSRDEAVINNIDTSDWYKQGVGTWFADFKMIQDFQNVGNGDLSNVIFNLSDNSSNVNRFDIYVTEGIIYNRLRVLDVNYDSYLSSPNSFGGKVASKFENGNHLLSFNGTTSTPNTSFSFIPIFTQLRIGRGSNVTAFLDGRIKKLSYYPIALTNNEIIDLSEE